MAAEFKVVRHSSEAFNDQQPGTSGLRKSVKRFQTPNYVENFIQSFFNVLNKNEPNGELTLVTGGDGRYFGEECTQKIIQLTAANPRVTKLLVAHNGIMSTPAVSCVIRKYKLTAGIILTASHNPGGPDADFGIKFNCANGGPAPSSVTDAVFSVSKGIGEYHSCPELQVDISRIAEHSFKIRDADGTVRNFQVNVIDSVDDYLELMKKIFDFKLLRNLFRSGARITINAMNGVMGPYVKRILCQELECKDFEVVKCDPLKDFGGLHPDPNLTYAEDLVRLMGQGIHDFGCAFDGDGDRNMILGKNAFFVTPCDSVAVIAANLSLIPYFRDNPIKGFARSMPTSGALDRVAKDLKKNCYETPTGWKFFGNLMDAGAIQLCGEESFGTGSDHIREKDGLWTVLAWLTIIEIKRMPVKKILQAHWQKYGRNFFSRYDYENCDAEACKNMMEELENKITDKAFVGTWLNPIKQTFGHDEEAAAAERQRQEARKPGEPDIPYRRFEVALGDNYEYTDPIDGSVTKKQGLRVIFSDGSRIIYRLSGTGSEGATVRVYIDSYVSDINLFDLDAQVVLQPLIKIALELSRLEEFTGRKEPTVIT